MRFRRGASATLAVAALAVAALAVAGGTAAVADSDRANRQSINTEADYTPGKEFAPQAASSPCTGALDEPFMLPAGYDQQVVAREPEGGTRDLWDMNTQNGVRT